MSNHNEDISTLDANEDEIVASDESEINDNEEKETGEEDENELSLQDKKEKTNKSNWKAMSKENKELRKANAELTAENEAWRKENPDLVKDVLSKGNNDFESRFFFIETPEAKDYKDEVLRTAQEYNIPYLKAWNLVKSELLNNMTKK